MSDAIEFDDLATLTDPYAGVDLATQLDNRYNALKNTVNGSPGILFARDLASESGLITAFFDGRVRSDGTVTDVPGGTETLDANATNYLEVDDSGVVSHTTTFFTDAKRPIAEITTDGASITDFVDKRVGFDFSNGAAAKFQVEQTAHGFALKNWVQRDGAGGWEKAQANSADNANTAALVVSVLDADTFTLQTAGLTEDIFTGLTDGSAQFLDPDTAGAQTETDAFAVGEIRQVLGVAVSDTAMIINIGTGFEIQEATVVVAAGKVLTVNNSLTLDGTDGEGLTLTKSLTVNGGDGVLTFPGAGATLTIPASGTAALLEVTNSWTANQIITTNITDPASTFSGVNLISQSNSLTANNSNIIRGFTAGVRLNQNGFNHTSGNGLRGYDASVLGSGASGTITQVSGYTAQTGNIGGGTVTTAVSYFANIALNSGGGTLTNWVGFDAAASTAATNNIGFRGNLTAAANRYNLHMSGTAQNYLAGNLGLGVTAPTAVLHLKAGGTAADSAPLKFTSGSFLTAAEAGVMGYNGRFALTESDATRRYIVQAAASTKTTAGAPYANDGYVVLTINGTDVKVMTTA